MKPRAILTQLAIGLAVLWIYDRFMKAPASSTPSSSSNTGTWA